MDFEPKSIGAQIECLARLTGAPQSFVMQVKVLFSSKGISLDSDAGPYIDALEEAFRREESIRHNSNRMKDNLTRTSENFNRLGRAYVRREGRAGKRADARGDKGAKPSSSQDVAVSRDHRAYVTHQQNESLPMVPGPKDLQ